MRTLPVPNLNSALVNEDRKLIPPWNMWFQQFSQNAPAVDAITVTASPFSFTANTIGTLIITGGTISNISLVRGTVTINLTGQRIIPIGIGDTVSITYSVLPTIQFLGG